MSDQEVMQAITSGQVCRLVGHQWREGRPGQLADEYGTPFHFAEYDPNNTYRTCMLCRKCQMRPTHPPFMDA